MAFLKISHSKFDYNQASEPCIHSPPPMYLRALTMRVQKGCDLGSCSWGTKQPRPRDHRACSQDVRREHFYHTWSVQLSPGPWRGWSLGKPWCTPPTGPVVFIKCKATVLIKLLTKVVFTILNKHNCYFILNKDCLDFRSPEDEARQQWRHHQPSQSVPTAGVATWDRGVGSFS